MSDKPARVELQLASALVSRMNPYFLPTKHTLRVLNERNWVASYSGGKDSTSLVTWIEWLRRTGLLKCDRPTLVQADTEAEYPFLTEVTEMMLSRLRACGWEAIIVRPPLEKKLYNSIFGLGQTPINPAFRGMRWCTRQTKIRPMEEYKKSTEQEGLVSLTGVRWGESEMRDTKLLERAGVTKSCNAGGECGLPQITRKNREEVFGPIITWKDSEVLSWLSGENNQVERTEEVMSDLREVSRRLLHVYHAKLGDEGFGLFPRKVHFMRFGCVGCPALKRDKVTKAMEKENPELGALNAIYDIWDAARLKYNRVRRFDEKKQKHVLGPIKIEARKKLFKKFLRIQERAGVALVNAADIQFIHECWDLKKYPGKDPDKWKEE